jgi:hypothetical protein
MYLGHGGERPVIHERLQVCAPVSQAIIRDPDGGRLASDNDGGGGECKTRRNGPSSHTQEKNGARIYHREGS